jgi:serine/threonine protein kinase
MRIELSSSTYAHIFSLSIDDNIAQHGGMSMSDSEDRVGQQLGNYRLVRLLGEGAFAEVYLGEHVHLGRQVAIKVLHTQLIKVDIDKFRNEARTIAALEHPNIVSVLDFGVEDRTPYLVLSYGVNGNLRQRHPKGAQVPLAIIVSYVKQLADALLYAHNEKFIHRDIKPENMLLGKHDEILLSDFGIAVMAQSSRYQNPQDMAGTMTYMAPEQIQGKPRAASDQYSLGIVVYEWLTGQRPFHGSLTELIGQHISVTPPSICAIVPSLSPAVEAVVMKALAKDPKARFAKIADFSLALEQVCQEPQLQTLATIQDTPPLDKAVDDLAPLKHDKSPLTKENVIASSIQLSEPDISVSSKRSSKTWFYEGLNMLENGQFVEALAVIKHALALDPDFGYAHNAQGLALYHLKFYTEALAALERAIALNSDDVTAHYGKGLTLEQLEQYPEALQAYERVTQLDPPHASGWRKKGDVLSRLKRYQDSFAAYEQAIKLDPHDADAYIGKGTVLKHLGRAR